MDLLQLQWNEETVRQTAAVEAAACKAGTGRQRQTEAPSVVVCEVQTAVLVRTGL